MLRRSARVLLGGVTVLVLVGGAREAAASEPGLAAPRSDPLIAHGEPVSSCGWPTVVAVGPGLCTGTLIHPRVVVYAAHCGGGLKTIRFGEDAWAGGRTVEVESCRAYPGYAGATDQGHDWAYCVLAEPVDLPVAPPLFGCEHERLQVGEEVAIVGFGEGIDEPGGIKRWAATTLAAVTLVNNTALVGNPSANLPSFCAGDSGGPGLIQLDQLDQGGSWRTFGIASTVAGECGGYGAHSLLAGAIAWIEETSGIDVTPCHASNGSWAPGPACVGALSSAPNVGAGSWADWCSETARVGALRSCGPAWDEFDASALPSVAIVAPSDRQTFLQGVEIEVVVAALKHPEGFAVASVSLEIDGEEVAIDNNDPWRFLGPPFPGPGVYSLVAVAHDWAGNRVASEPVLIGWGETEFPEPGEADDDSDDSETGDESPPRSGGSSRCTVVDAPARGGGLLLLGVLALGFWRLRR
jgi:hypothetical protein